MLLSSSLEKALVPNLAFWRECFADLSGPEVCAKVLTAPWNILYSHLRLRERAALLEARGIPRALLWGKVGYTDEAFSKSLEKWAGKHR